MEMWTKICGPCPGDPYHTHLPFEHFDYVVNALFRDSFGILNNTRVAEERGSLTRHSRLQEETRHRARRRRRITLRGIPGTLRRFVSCVRLGSLQQGLLFVCVETCFLLSQFPANHASKWLMAACVAAALRCGPSSCTGSRRFSALQGKLQVQVARLEIRVSAVATDKLSFNNTRSMQRRLVICKNCMPNA